jgi:hypothetical protein
MIDSNDLLVASVENGVVYGIVFFFVGGHSAPLALSGFPSAQGVKGLTRSVTALLWWDWPNVFPGPGYTTS